MGLALSDKHLAVIRKLTHNVALALDADTAGEEATLRLAAGQEALGKEVVPVPTWSGLVRYENALDAEVKVVVLPRGKDPDEVIMDDLSRWKGLVSAAPPIIDYAIEVVAGKADLNLARDKTSAADKMLPLVLEIKDPVRQAHYVQKLSRMLRTNEQALWAAMKRLPLTRRPGPLTAATAAIPQHAALPGKNPIEEYLLALLVQFPELREAGNEVLPDYFEASENRELFVRWREAPDIDTLTRGLDDYLREYLEQLRRRPFPPVLTDRESERQHTVGDCALRLKERWLKGLAAKREELLTLEKQADGPLDEVVKDEPTAPDTGSKLKDVFEKRRMQRYTRRNR
jgi:DNA primase